MPVFEYRCKQCGHVTSFLEHGRPSKSHLCASCGSKRTEKLLSTFAARSGLLASPAAAACQTCPASSDSCRRSCPLV